VYGDTRGNRPIHRTVVEAMRAEKPDFVVFTGDALTCVPAGHVPDYGGWNYLIPFWPQYHRAYPAVVLLSIIPFPALIGETLIAPFLHVRDSDGFNAFLEDTAPLRENRIPLLFVPGNHDLYHHPDRAEVARLFGQGADPNRSPKQLWFAVDAGHYRFVILDSGTDLLGDADPMPAGGPQLTWLEATLADAEQKGLHSVVALHLPPFSSAREDGSVPWVEERLVKGILDKHRVALVLNGHAHAYERVERPGRDGRPLQFIVTGGGGAPFFHESSERVAGSKVFVEGTPHFVMLELGPESLHGRMVPVALPGGPVPAPGEQFDAQF
jgi:3',5'-cyclic AMP phosphodiesterase CpdA